MKASCLYLTLGVVPLVICTPVPWLLQQPGGDALASPVIRFAPETSSVEGSQAVESAEAPRGFAPHRQSPIKAAQPSVLPPLSRHRPPAPTEKSETSEPDAAFAPYPAHDNSEPPDPVESQTAETPRSAIPCYQASSPCEQDDVLVVYFAAAFMLVVVVMETWRSVFGRYAFFFPLAPVRWARASLCG